MRIGDLTDALHRLAEQLPDGADTEVLLGACDGLGLYLAEHTEVTTLTRVDQSGGPRPPAGLLRTHLHDENAVYLPGVAETFG